jgi:hypothetical protein
MTVVKEDLHEQSFTVIHTVTKPIKEEQDEKKSKTSRETSPLSTMGTKPLN